MTLRLYNTYTRQKEDFTPIDFDHVKMYVCGPTVYAPPHIGNGRPVVVFDVLFRLLRHLYPNVTYVRNITDVDDKINAQSKEMGQPIHEITTKVIKLFHETCDHLESLLPTIEPKATDHIQDILGMISTLIEKGYAYAKDGHVLFRVAHFKEYGKLSKRNTEELLAGARVEVAPYKENAEDFVLWKPSDESLPGWDSPYGRGRPGWHIECSAMSARHLGKTFDIHGGGIDLVFPHHENEIAQSSACYDTTMANVWMHNGHLTVEGQKMSKSLGNVIILQDILQKIPGQVIRLALLSSHYRQPLDWTHSLVDQTTKTLDKFAKALGDFSEEEWKQNYPIDEAVLKALQDDLNTPLAFSYLHQIASDIMKLEGDKRKALQRKLLSSLRLLGFFETPIAKKTKEKVLQISVDQVEDLLSKRLEARKNKDFKESDRIRDYLVEMGVVVKDTPQGQEWSPL